jgi:hypothetical protein
VSSSVPAVDLAQIEGHNDAEKMLIDREKMLVLPFSKSPLAWL